MTDFSHILFFNFIGFLFSKIFLNLYLDARIINRDGMNRNKLSGSKMLLNTHNQEQISSNAYQNVIRINNLNRMIIIVNFLFIISNTSFSAMIFMMALNLSQFTIQLSQIVSNLLLYITHISSIFVYYFFDKLYKKLVRSKFKLL